MSDELTDPQRLDTRRAIIVDTSEMQRVAQLSRDTKLIFALTLEGVVNRERQDRARVMALVGLEGMAVLITQMHAIADQAGVLETLREACRERWAAMPAPSGEPGA